MNLVDPVTIAGLAAPLVADIVSGMINDACIRTAKRAKKGLTEMRGGNEALTNAQIVNMLIAPQSAQDITLSTLVSLPQSAVTAHAFRVAVETHSVKAITQQIICALLVRASEETFADIREAFILALQQALRPHTSNEDDLTPAASELFDLVRSNAERALPPATEQSDREPTAEIFAQLTLLHASIGNVRSLVESLSLRQSPEQTKLTQEWTSLYRKQCAKRHGVITPPDFKERNTVPLDKIYVPARISVVDEGSKYGRHRSLYDIIDDLDRDVLVGDPGGGKSTTTHAIAYKLAETPEAVLPFLVVLREYAQHSDTMSILEYIEKQLRTLYQAEPPIGIIGTFLDSGEALVIFDGLDELIDSSRRIAIAERIEMFSTRYPMSKIYVTSRKVGYKEAQLDPSVFRVLELEGYTQEDIEAYVSKWFSIQGSAGGVDTTALQRSFINESAAIPDLRSNPLLLALLCIIYRGQGYLPKNRIGIYEECSKLLFETWDKSRGIVFNFTFESYLSEALKHLAFWMWNDNDADEGVTEDRLIAELTSYFSGRAYETEDAARKAAAEFVEFCSGRAWVLSEAGMNSDNISLFKFTHRTFMEYFAAIQVNRLNPEPKKLARFLLPKVARNEWDTVGQLCIHLIHRSAHAGADVTIAQMLKSSESRSITYRENVLDFIARCLSDLPVAPKLVKKVIRASVNNLCKAHEQKDTANGQGFSFSSISWRRLAHLETNSEIIREEFDQAVDELFEVGTSNTREVACLILSDIVFSGSHHALQIPEKRQRDWQEFARSKFNRYHDEALTLDEYRAYIALEMYLLDALSFEEFHRLVLAEDDNVLDFLVRPMRVLTDGGSRSSPSLSFSLINLGSAYLSGSADAEVRINQRWLRLLNEVAQIMVQSGPPFVRLEQCDTRHSGVFFHYLMDLGLNDIKSNSPEWAVICILIGIHLEIDRQGAGELKKVRRRSEESLVSRMLSSRESGETLPADLLESLGDSSPILKEVIISWSRRELDLVAT